MNATQTQPSPYFIPLLLAGMWNLVIGGIGLFSNDVLASFFLLRVTEVTTLFLQPLFWAAVMVFGVGYSLVAFRHDRMRFFISIGAALKVVVFLVLGTLWLTGSCTLIALMAGTGDLLWAIYFLWFLRRTAQHGDIWGQSKN